MSNWDYLNSRRIRKGEYASTKQDGFNGAFILTVPNDPRSVCVIASDKLGWEHVSVSFGQVSKKTPSWEIMCFVKDLFWEDHHCVIQFHPPKSDYVNIHPGCLHLWRCITPGLAQPMPPQIMV